MNVFDYTLVEETSKQLYIRALCDLPPDVREALKQAYEKESQPSAKEIFKTMLKNVEVADGKKTLICQDTGLPIYMVKIGSGFNWDGAEVKERLTVGAVRATQEYPFRGSSTHFLTRVNPQTSVGERLPVFYFDFTETEPAALEFQYIIILIL